VTAGYKHFMPCMLDKMEWSGEMIGGHTKDGMVWVFPAEYRVSARGQVK
jgi:hypothetical protein